MPLASFPLRLLASLALAATLAGCRPEAPPAPAPAAPSPGTDAPDASPSADAAPIDCDALAGEAGPLRVTVLDTLSLLAARTLLPAEPLPWPAFDGVLPDDVRLRDTIGQALETAALREQIPVPSDTWTEQVDPHLRAWVDGAPPPFEPPPSERLPDGFLTELVRDRQRYLDWQQREKAALTDEALRSAWDVRADLRTADVLLLLNAPPADAVERFVETEAPAIERAWRERTGSFTLPPGARASIVRQPFPAGDDDARERAVQELQRRLDAGELTDALAAEAGVEVTWAQFPHLRDAELGAPVGPHTDRNSAWVATVHERLPRRTPPLDDALRRRIARELLRERAVQPEAHARAVELIAAWQRGDEALQAELRAPVERVQRTPPFPRNEIGSVPAAGRAPELLEALFDPARSPGDVLPRPFLASEGVAVARLVEQQLPTDERWTLERDAFRAHVEASIERTGWQDYLAQRFARETPRFHTDTLARAWFTCLPRRVATPTHSEGSSIPAPPASP